MQDILWKINDRYGSEEPKTAPSALSSKSPKGNKGVISFAFVKALDSYKWVESIMVGEEKRIDVGVRLVMESRGALLSKAIDDTKKYCALASSMVDRKHPDTFWIELFDPTNTCEITDQDAHRLLTSFQLTNRVEWNKVAVAKLINEIRSRAAFEPTVDVPTLANDMRSYNKRHTRQTSAASKIAFLSKPRSKVFIWDSLASRSARLRDWRRERLGRKHPSSAVYTDSRGEHDYPAFYAACDRMLGDERNSTEFMDAVETLEREFRRGSGVMADRAKIPFDFIERRLLDKLMFWEGWTLKYNELPAIASV